MAKLTCSCGHTIVDQAINLPYKGYLLKDDQAEVVWDELYTINTLIEAIKHESIEAWIKNHFDVPPYPTDTPPSSMIHDLVTDKFFDTAKTVYECEQCGRIWIQDGKSEKFKSFKPE